MATELPSQDTIPSSRSLEQQGTSTGEIPNGSLPKYRAITHVAALTTFFLPFFVLPYLLSRRKISTIQRGVDKLEASVRLLQQDLDRISSDFALQKDGYRGLKTSVYNIMRETDELRAQAEQMERKRTMSDERVRSDMRRIIDETQRLRTQTATLRALGMSLADVAAFMHEIELEMGMNKGKDSHGIEKLRHLAMRIESLPQQDEDTKEGLTNKSTRQSS